MIKEQERVVLKAAANDAVMERVDAAGRVIGFSVMGVSKFEEQTAGSRPRRCLSHD